MLSLSSTRDSETARCRLCIRNLPSSMTRDELLDFLSASNVDQQNVFFLPGTTSKYSPNDSCSSSAFITFPSEQILHSFYNEICNKLIQGKRLLIEFAPIQSMPFPSGKKDPYEGTIEEDEYFKTFVNEQNGTASLEQATASLRMLQMGPTIGTTSLTTPSGLPKLRRKPFKLDLATKKNTNGPTSKQPLHPSVGVQNSEKAPLLGSKIAVRTQTSVSQTDPSKHLFCTDQESSTSKPQKTVNFLKQKGNVTPQISKKSASEQPKFELRKKV